MVLNSLIIQLLLAVITIKGISSENQRCYVCIPNIGSSIADVIQTFPSGPSLPLCNAFRKDKVEYIRECPSSKYVGCLTQTNGTHITKTCSSIGVEDCKTANKIEYCYCKGQLCNGGNVPVEEARPPSMPSGGSGDDDEDTESYIEGSGSSEEASRERKEHTTLDVTGIEVPRITTIRPSKTTIVSKTSPSSAALPKLAVELFLIAFLSFLRVKLFTYILL